MNSPRFLATLLLLAMLVACVRTPNAPDTNAALNDSASHCAGDPFGEPFMRGVIRTLAQPSWEGRKFDSQGLELATQWVRDQFECIGLTPGAPMLPGLPKGSFDQPFDTDGDEMSPATDISDYAYDPEQVFSFTNVIGSIPGSGVLASEVIVIGAHIDHMGKYGKEDDAMILGADDNASGVLALLAMAKQVLADGPHANRRTLVFAAWGVEEDPFYLRGSRAFFKALDEADATAKDRILYYVNFDMVGGYSYHNRLHVMGTFDAVPNTSYGASPARRLMTTILSNHAGIKTDLGDRGSSSDQATFCENGIPYAFFWTQDDCYHEPCDTPENIDYAHMGAILRMATELAKALATEPDLETAKSEFPQAYLAAYPGESCTSQD